MRNTLLRDSDFMSMAHGLELRVPFLDRTLVEACFRIPGDKKLQGDLPKSLLLASLGVELPREIVNRPKRGFTLPFERWLRGEMRPVVEDALLKSDWDQTSISASRRTRSLEPLSCGRDFMVASVVPVRIEALVRAEPVKSSRCLRSRMP